MSNKTSADSNQSPMADTLLQQIADYVVDTPIQSALAMKTAAGCLADALGCAVLALNYPACTKLLGAIVPQTVVPKGSRVIGCSHTLDPVKAAFDNGALIRWLDFNDTWLAAEWGHPSDNFAAILSVADYLSQNGSPLTMKAVLEAAVKAYEIQGVLALNNSLNQVGLDHVALVKLASTAVVTQLLGGTREIIVNALSHVMVDGQALRTYRHAPNTMSRKSWAAGDASARAVFLSLLALKGEPGIPSVLTTPGWGFQDVLFKGNPFELARPFGSYVMENILFKLSYPAEFHAQTAVEAGVQLHPLVKDKLDSIERIELKTQESAVRIISKEGPLHNPADRDHCLQYMVAIALLEGDLTAAHYEDSVAQDRRIDALRQKMVVSENPIYTKEYLEADKRSIGNSVQVFFQDGSQTACVAIDYPIGHPRRREEGEPVLRSKFKTNVATQFDDQKVSVLCELMQDEARLQAMPVSAFMQHWVK